MPTYRSIIEARDVVTFPEFTGERVYMQPFRKATGLPPALARWQPTVDAMLDGIDTDDAIYIMIDQSAVIAGATQRRPGLHIDGYWNPGISAHGGGRHTPTPIHRPEPRPAPGRHGTRAGGWSHATFDAAEAIILASSVPAARGFVGAFSGVIGDMGDCAHIDVSGLDVIPMDAGRVYAGNVCCLHESLPVDRDCVRSLVRLNVPGWTPTA